VLKVFKICLVLTCQEDLTVDDINTIIDELKAGKTPKAGPWSVLVTSL